MDFKCLFCLEPLKDADLVCLATCDHKIHEWCLDPMKMLNEHNCRICKKSISISLIFKEFDLSKNVIIEGMGTIIKKLDEMVALIKSRESEIKDLKHEFEEMSDKMEGLSIEHHALKFEKKEMEKRLKHLEHPDQENSIKE